MFSRLIVLVIKIYQLFISPVLGQNCRYYPSCSNYSIEAIKKFGFIKGITLAVKRILKCNPWGGSGIDLVPEKNAKNKN